MCGKLRENGGKRGKGGWFHEMSLFSHKVFSAERKSGFLGISRIEIHIVV